MHASITKGGFFAPVRNGPLFHNFPQLENGGKWWKNSFFSADWSIVPLCSSKSWQCAAREGSGPFGKVAKVQPLASSLLRIMI